MSGCLHIVFVISTSNLFEISSATFLKTNISLQKSWFENDLPFPKVVLLGGYLVLSIGFQRRLWPPGESEQIQARWTWWCEGDPERRVVLGTWGRWCRSKQLAKNLGKLLSLFFFGGGGWMFDRYNRYIFCWVGLMFFWRMYSYIYMLSPSNGEFLFTQKDN